MGVVHHPGLTRIGRALGVLLVGACQSPPPCVDFPMPTQEVGLVPAFPSLPPFQYPVMTVRAPGDEGVWMVAQRTGEVLKFTEATQKPERVLDLSDRVDAEGDAGLSAVLPDPNYAQNRVFYVFYATSSPAVLGDGSGKWRARLSRFTEGAVSSADEQVLLEVEETESSHIHANGDLQFGPDGALYLSLGDGGPQGDRDGHAQDLTSLRGKILRILVDPSKPGYEVPADNPFVGQLTPEGEAIRPEIWAYGLRNPWRFSFEAPGVMWLGEVGYADWEEINRVEAGDNLGWPVLEGPVCFEAQSCDTTGLTPPVVAHDHYAARAIVGGHFYRGTAVPTLAQHYVYADYQFGQIWAFGADRVPRIINRDGHTLTSVAQDPRGELIVVDIVEGSLLRLVDGEGQPGEDGLPKHLSETGCVSALSPAIKSDVLYQYTINLPFWSDGAEKSRWLGVPADATIEIEEDGDLDLPPGSVLLKEFGLGTDTVETRIMAYHGDDRWTFLSYRWNEAQDDAVLLPEQESVVAVDWAAGTWTHPTRGMCNECHGNAPGVSLGLELAQLQGPPIDPRLGAEQVAGLVAYGVLDPAPEVLPFPTLDDASAPIDTRARAWLHVNCAYCHRPNGRGRGDMDMRFTTLMADTLMCDQRPDFGELAGEDSRVIAPGRPEQSVLLTRILALDDNAMPPLGRSIVDAEAAAVIEAWIAGMSEACE